MTTTPDEMALMRAIKNEDWGAIEALIMQSVNVNIMHHGSSTLLMWAASTGNPRLIDILSKSSNLELDAQDDNLHTALQHAITKEQWKAVITLAKLGVNVNTLDQSGHIPLVDAINNKQWDVVEALLQAGAKANIMYDRNMTLLMWAAAKGNTTLIHLISKAQDLKETLTRKNSNSNTALMLALQNKQWEAAKILFDLGANLTTSNRWGDTPLILAAAYGNPDIIRYIFSKIPDPKTALEKQDIDDNTALMCAVNNKQWEAVEVLIELGAKIDTPNKYGYTPLKLLLRHAHLPVVQKIISFSNTSTETIKNAQERDRLIDIIKEAGHILGFKTPVSGIKPEGMFIDNKHPGCLMLEKYLDKLPSSIDHSKIKEALELSSNFYRKNEATEKNVNYKELIEYYQNGNCTILPIRWVSPEGAHAITLVVWNDILVICNRGDKKLKEGISVFRIPTTWDNRSKITQEFLEIIMPKDGRVSAETVLHEIRSCVGQREIEHPILTFASLEQQYGNCGFVNLKSSLYPIFVFLALLKDNEMNPQEFNYRFLLSYLLKSQDLEKQKKIQIMKAVWKTAYKEFSRGMRDANVKELCADFQKLPVDSETRKVYLEMFSAILHEHYGQEKNSFGRTRRPEKIKAEQERARQILSVMTQAEQQKTLAVLTKLHNKNTRTANSAEAVAQLLQQLEEYKVVITQLETKITQSETTALSPKTGDNANINAVLLLAAKKNLSDIILFLAQQPGIDLNTKDKEGCTALLLVAERGRWDVARFLMKQPHVDLNAKDNDTKTTLLHFAAADGLLDVVEFLAQRPEVDINAKDNEGDTAVLLAAKQERWDCVSYLLQMPSVVLEQNEKADILRRAEAAKQTMVINLLQPTVEMKLFAPMLTVHISQTNEVTKKEQKRDDDTRNKPTT